jgi:hypothetical protein
MTDEFIEPIRPLIKNKPWYTPVDLIGEDIDNLFFEYLYGAEFANLCVFFRNHISVGVRINTW